MNSIIINRPLRDSNNAILMSLLQDEHDHII
jgi:hypothetical protein